MLDLFNLNENWPQKEQSVKMQKISFIVDFIWFGNKVRVGIMSRTSINQVNKKRHLGLVRKTLILHSLKIWTHAITNVTK